MGSVGVERFIKAYRESLVTVLKLELRGQCRLVDKLRECG